MSATAQPKVLVVLSSAARGWYLPEFAHPYEVLSPHTQIVVASPKGGVTFVDPTSIQLNKDDAYCVEFLNTKQSLWTETEKLSEFVGKASEFAAIFVVGGFGPMYDLVSDPITIQLLREFYEADKFVTAVCHGSAALVNVKLADGTNLVANEAVTGFSNEEDEAFLGFFPDEEVTPFLLQDALMKASGGNYKKSAAAWESIGAC